MNTVTEVLDKLTEIQRPFKIWVFQDKQLMNYHYEQAKVDLEEKKAHENLVRFYKHRFNAGEFLLRALQEYVDELNGDSLWQQPDDLSMGEAENP